MKAKDILLTIWFICDEDYDKSFAYLKERKPMSDELIAKTLANVDRDAYATIIDEGYPEDLKSASKPPLAIKLA